MPDNPVAIVVAEDNPRDCEFLRSTLNEFQLHIANNGRDALDLVKSKDIQLLVSDLQMPGLNGVELCRRVWDHMPKARIVFWSQHRDEVYLRALAKIIPPETVYGYVLKSNPSEVLRQAIDFVFFNCQCWIDPKVRSVQARGTPQSDIISEVEYEVLLDIALGLTDNMIALRRYLTRRGVQSRLKLHNDAFNSRARAVAIAFQRGLINHHEMEQAEEALQKWFET